MLEDNGWSLEELKAACEKIQNEKERLAEVLNNIGVTSEERNEWRNEFFQIKQKRRFEHENFLLKTFNLTQLQSSTDDPSPCITLLP